MKILYYKKQPKILRRSPPGSAVFNSVGHEHVY